MGGAAVMAGITWMCLLQGVPSWGVERGRHILCPLTVQQPEKELNGCLAAVTQEAGACLWWPASLLKTGATAGSDPC